MSYLFTPRYMKVATVMAVIAVVFTALVAFLPSLTLSETGLAVKFGAAIAALVVAAWLPTMLEQRHVQMLATAVGMIVMLIMGALGVLGWLGAGAGAGTKSLAVALCWLVLAAFAGVAGAAAVRWLDISAVKQRQQAAPQSVVDDPQDDDVEEEEEGDEEAGDDESSREDKSTPAYKAT